MAFNFVFWATKEVDYGARLAGLENFGDEGELHRGIAHRHDIPKDATFRMDPDYPDNTVLADHMANTNCLVVVSDRLKAFLESLSLEQVEFLPVRVLDHRQREVKPPFHIVSPLGTVACLKLDECQISEEDRWRIHRLQQLVVDESALPANRRMLRIERLARYVAVDRDLAAAIDAAGFTGNRWVTAEELASDDIPSDLSFIPPPDDDD